MKKRNYFLLLPLFLVACSSGPDPEKLAAQYCACMKENNATEDFNVASKVCMDKFIGENRYYRLWNVTMRDEAQGNKIPQETQDSVRKFMFRFVEVTEASCCKEVLACPDSIKRY